MDREMMEQAYFEQFSAELDKSGFSVVQTAPNRFELRHEDTDDYVWYHGRPFLTLFGEKFYPKTEAEAWEHLPE